MHNKDITKTRERTMFTTIVIILLASLVLSNQSRINKLEGLLKESNELIKQNQESSEKRGDMIENWIEEIEDVRNADIAYAEYLSKEQNQGEVS